MDQYVKINSVDRLVKVSCANERGLPFRSATFYQWRAKGKNLSLFRKVGRTLFIDLVELQRMIDDGKLEA